MSHGLLQASGENNGLHAAISCSYANLTHEPWLVPGVLDEHFVRARGSAGGSSAYENASTIRAIGEERVDERPRTDKSRGAVSDRCACGRIRDEDFDSGFDAGIAHVRPELIGSDRTGGKKTRR